MAFVPRDNGLEQYVIELIGSSLRHSFRTPLSIIVNALREVEQELRRRRVSGRFDYATFKTMCAQVYDLRTKALKRYHEMGSTFRNRNVIVDLTKTKSLLSVDVEPILKEIRSLCSQIRSLVSGIKDNTIDEFSKLADLESNRMIRIYDGIIKIVNVPSEIRLKEKNVSLWGRLDVVGQQIRRNFKLSDEDIKNLDLPRQSPTIEGSRALIDLLCLNILENAVRYALRAPKFAVRATVSEIDCAELMTKYPTYLQNTRADGKWAEIHFFNNGAPVPRGKEEDIFRLYMTTEEPNDEATGGGSGIGLALARLIATLHGGVLFVNPASSDQTDFTLLLPIERRPSDLAANILLPKAH
jgi:signal transduction histidine kinase